MRIVEMFGSSRPVVSFEFFPPKTAKGYPALFRTIEDLKRLEPSFVSVTWGAGGSTRRKTTELVVQIQQEADITAMAHMTCVGSGRDEIADTIDSLADAGIENLLALGGDRPEGWQPGAQDFSYANELIEFARPRWPDLCIAAAAYPEGHPQSPSPEQDLAMTYRKVEAGAEVLITQLFFDNADYFEFVRRARAAGIDTPIVPGIMPVVSVANIRRMTALCGAKIPSELGSALDACGEDPERTLEVGIEWAVAQCRELLEGGAPGLHFYTLNRSPATRRIHERVFGATA
ncbi:MAG: methylenetetrahydrofolate reductase [NAD(P)H] [Deltaproteobacteria bacterium]|nr:methylenetetrahydrofolate reductase [NAD(P)H] [Deltaproteobacteria bacterium]MBW2414194.1 methylenetetrahydrofolate reductase [NAD(P)H] [Deltaproteobacteria bacterium]